MWRISMTRSGRHHAHESMRAKADVATYDFI